VEGKKMSSRPFARSVLRFNHLEVSICPVCGLMVAGSRDRRLLRIAESAHGAQHRKPPLKTNAVSRRRVAVA
jgi:hypothetical protein